MRVLFCGDRHLTERAGIRNLLDLYPRDTVVIHGAAPGADSIAGEEAAARGMTVEAYAAEWSKYGRRAGPLRNQRMLDEGKPDEVVAVHDRIDQSTGTRDMMRRAERAGIPVTLYGSRGQ